MVFSCESRKINKFRLAYDHLVCGFDGEAREHVSEVVGPGVTISHESDNIGVVVVVAETAGGRHIWNKAETVDDFDISLYQAHEAKGYAENIQGFGIQTDVWILTTDRKIPGASEPIMELLKPVFEFYSLMPLKKMPRYFRITLRLREERRHSSAVSNHSLVRSLGRD